jgi:fumarylacetoacetate (FAA) hydrolase
MKLATLKNGTPDGALVVVSQDSRMVLSASAVAPNLLCAIANWDGVVQGLQSLSNALDSGKSAEARPFIQSECAAPLPRTFQWCDASAFLNHGRLMEKAFNTPAIPDFDTVPVMYQGASDDFLGAHDDVALPSEEDGIDFEGEFGVVLAETPMGIDSVSALDYVRLVVQINDWSLRRFGPREMGTGFGFLQAKPSTSFAPVAVTPDVLGDAWKDGRVAMNLHVSWNGQWFGHPGGGEMNFSFGELIAHAAKTRRLSAGTVIGSGTVSNASRANGTACIAERRVIETIDEGRPSTPFMRFGDRVSMEARFQKDIPGPFGTIDQRVVQARAIQRKSLDI